MTQLPSAKVIQDLTKANILLVAEAYIDQLCQSPHTDPSRAKTFLMTALRRSQRDEKHAIVDAQTERDKIAQMLEIVPNVRLKGRYEARDIEPEAWLIEQNIAFRIIWFRRRWVYMFDNLDDAMLFKLKWYQ